MDVVRIIKIKTLEVDFDTLPKYELYFLKIFDDLVPIYYTNDVDFYDVNYNLIFAYNKNNNSIIVSKYCIYNMECDLNLTIEEIDKLLKILFLKYLSCDININILL